MTESLHLMHALRVLKEYDLIIEILVQVLYKALCHSVHVKQRVHLVDRCKLSLQPPQLAQRHFSCWWELNQNG